MDEKARNTHKILFAKSRLYLDGVQIAGIGITPEKDVLFEFAVKEDIVHKKIETPVKDPAFLEINVVDNIKSKDIGPGQSGK